MYHDFDASHAGTGCDGTGFMSYGSHPHQWSTCSVSDFNALFQSIISSPYYSWCLAGKLFKALRVSLRTRPDTESQSIKSMCPMLPDHNFLVSGAEWPTEKHIKKLGPSFSIIWRNLTFSVLTHVETM